MKKQPTAKPTPTTVRPSAPPVAPPAPIVASTPGTARTITLTQRTEPRKGSGVVFTLAGLRATVRFAARPSRPSLRRRSRFPAMGSPSRSFREQK